MNIIEAAELLERHNKWRRGDDNEGMADPAMLGVAIDVAVAALKQQPTQRTQKDAENNYASVMAEIDEILRVARDNPAGLLDFLAVNWPDAGIRQPTVTREEVVEIMAKAMEPNAWNHCFKPSDADATPYWKNNARKSKARKRAGKCYDALIAAGIVKVMG